MSNVSVSFRLPEETKRQLEGICEELGISMASAFTMFANSVVRERALPSEVTKLKPAKETKHEFDDKYLARLIESRGNETQDETNARILRGIDEIEKGDYAVYGIEELREIVYGDQM